MHYAEHNEKLHDQIALNFIMILLLATYFWVMEHEQQYSRKEGRKGEGKKTKTTKGQHHSWNTAILIHIKKTWGGADRAHV